MFKKKFLIERIPGRLKARTIPLVIHLHNSITAELCVNRYVLVRSQAARVEVREQLALGPLNRTLVCASGASVEARRQLV